MRRLSIRIAIVGIGLVGAVTLAWAYSGNPPDLNDGGYGCTCHTSAPFSDTGTVTITATTPVPPDFYYAGDTVDISVDITQFGKIRWGFVMMADGGAAGNGTWVITDPARTQLSTTRDTVFVKNTALGTDSGTADVAPGWNFRWVAPTNYSNYVTFYISALAADGDGTEANDNAYNASLSLVGLSQCILNITGDVNDNVSITSSDIIYLVAYVFKGGPAPVPCPAAGDVNCDGAITSADIIYLVSFVFRGGPRPCDACTLIPGTWTCP